MVTNLSLPLVFFRVVVLALAFNLLGLAGCSSSDSGTPAVTNEGESNEENIQTIANSDESGDKETNTDAGMTDEATDQTNGSDASTDDEPDPADESGQEGSETETDSNGNASSADSDGDLLTDQQEIGLGTDPLNADSDGNDTTDANEDLDEDGVSNYVEYSVDSSPVEFDEPRFVYTQRALVIFSQDSETLSDNGETDFNEWALSEYFLAVRETEDVNRKISFTLRGESVSEELANQRAAYLSDLFRSALSFQTISIIVIPPLVNTDDPANAGAFDERVRIEYVVTSDGGDVGNSITGYTGFVGDD